MLFNPVKTKSLLLSSHKTIAVQLIKALSIHTIQVCKFVFSKEDSVVKALKFKSECTLCLCPEIAVRGRFVQESCLKGMDER